MNDLALHFQKLIDHLREEQPVAYFSMEIALHEEIPTYSGGLGILAGDVVRTASDLNLAFIGVTQLSRKGYFRQRLDADGNQIEEPANWRPEERMHLVPTRAKVEIEGREVTIQAWVCECQSVIGRPVPVFFLDTDLPENHPADRGITDALYGGDQVHRLKQEIILGVGGTRILEALGLPIRKYHINEGHAALLVLELWRRLEGASPEARLKALRERCVFTTHTPVEAGHDKFPYDMVGAVLGELVPFSLLQQLAGEAQLNMTMLALNASGYVNGVAERHRQISSAMFPGHVIRAITNGVHSFTWTSPPIRRLFDTRLPGWAAEPLLLARMDTVPDFEVWEAHQEAKRDLLALVKEQTGKVLEEGVLTIGFARRFTQYKRPHLIFSNPSRLRRVTRRGPLQIVFGGKAHPRDGEGKRLIREIFQAIRELEDDVRIVYLPEYDMATAKKLVAGVDVWLNTPQPPLEASGTSGMKAAHNGVLNFSVLDGWWLEGHLEGVTGWSIGPSPSEQVDPSARLQQEVDDLYGKLEYNILPMYYHNPAEWRRMMKESIDDLASYFNTHRMLRRYVTDAYFPRGSYNGNGAP